MKRALIIALILPALLSCGHVVSKKGREGVIDVPFRTVRADIEKYVGSYFVWGGFVVKTEPGEAGTRIEVVQNPLDSRGLVEDTDISYGRFVVLSAQELDPLIFAKDRLITVSGRLEGSEEVTRGGKKYVYPVIEATELHLWKEEPLYCPPDDIYWRRPYKPYRYYWWRPPRYYYP